MKYVKYIVIAIMALLILPVVAMADSPQRTLSLSDDQSWLIIISAIVPAFAYVFNRFMPWVDEKVKAVVFVLLAAVVGGVDVAIQTGNFGWNSKTAGYIVTAVATALAAHSWFYKPSGISTVLRGGTAGEP